MRLIIAMCRELIRRKSAANYPRSLCSAFIPMYLKRYFKSEIYQQEASL